MMEAIVGGLVVALIATSYQIYNLQNKLNVLEEVLKLQTKWNSAQEVANAEMANCLEIQDAFNKVVAIKLQDDPRSNSSSRFFESDN